MVFMRALMAVRIVVFPHAHCEIDASGGSQERRGLGYYAVGRLARLLSIQCRIAEASSASPQLPKFGEFSMHRDQTISWKNRRAPTRCFTLRHDPCDASDGRG